MTDDERKRNYLFARIACPFPWCSRSFQHFHSVSDCHVLLLGFMEVTNWTTLDNSMSIFIAGGWNSSQLLEADDLAWNIYPQKLSSSPFLSFRLLSRLLALSTFLQPGTPWKYQISRCILTHLTSTNHANRISLIQGRKVTQRPFLCTRFRNTSCGSLDLLYFVCHTHPSPSRASDPLRKALK